MKKKSRKNSASKNNNTNVVKPMKSPKKSSKSPKKTKKTQRSNSLEPIEITPKLIVSNQELREFLKILPKCLTINSRLQATKNLLDIKNEYLIEKFIQLKGLSILGSWLKEYKVSVKSGTELTRDEEFIVQNIIFLCDRMHLSINVLKESKIGKYINGLGKALGEDKKPKKFCENIVAKWRKMISETEGDGEPNEEIKNLNPVENNLNSMNNGFINHEFTDSNQINNFNNNNNVHFTENFDNDKKQFLGSKTKRNNNQNNFNNNSINSNSSNKINYPYNSKKYVNHFQLILFKILNKVKCNKAKVKVVILFFNFLLKN